MAQAASSQWAVVDGGKLNVVVADDQDNLVVFHGETGAGKQARHVRPPLLRRGRLPLAPPSTRRCALVARALLSSRPLSRRGLEEEAGAAVRRRRRLSGREARRRLLWGPRRKRRGDDPVDEMVFRRLYKLQVSDPRE